MVSELATMATYEAGIFKALDDFLGKRARCLLLDVAFRGLVVERYFFHGYCRVVFYVGWLLKRQRRKDEVAVVVVTGPRIWRGFSRYRGHRFC